MRISLIIPTLNEQDAILATLSPLQAARRQAELQLIVVDGGSQDDTRALAEPLCDAFLCTESGRAVQMNRGAEVATGDWLLFLHADTRLPDNWLTQWQRVTLESSRLWGRFDLRLSGRGTSFRLIERMINLRSRFSGIATGDQAIFVRRDCFLQLGGYAPIPLMEDVELCRRLKRLSKPLCLPTQVTTSSRRWEQKGVWRTVLLMWRIRLLYFLGANPSYLAGLYRGRVKQEVTP